MTGTIVIDMKDKGARMMLQTIAVKAHLKMLSIGMKNSRMTGTQVLSMAASITGKAYKRGQYATALSDVQAIIDAAKAA